MGKYTLNVITAHNGVEVLSITPTTYVHTVFDDIIADWRKQQLAESKKQRQEELTVKGMVRKAIKKAKEMI